LRIRHRLSISLDAEGAELFHRYGIKDEPASAWRSPVGAVSGNTVLVNIYEDAECWPEIAQYLSSRNKNDFVVSEFTESELVSAKYLCIWSTWHHQFPLPSKSDDPELDMGYLQATYDPTDACPECSIGYRQRAPFRLRSEPKWGSKSFLQLNWVFDEFFTKIEVFERLLRKQGVNVRPVVKNSTGNALNSVVQLDVHASCEILGKDRLRLERTCPECGSNKYLAHRHGFFPSVSVQGEPAIIKTKE